MESASTRVTPELLAAIVRDLGGDWVSADLVHRMARQRLGYSSADREAPTLALVARRLANVPGLERTVYDGHWVYRVQS